MSSLQLSNDWRSTAVTQTSKLADGLPEWARTAPYHGNSFVVAMAVPNITGSLHIGHALDLLLNDVIVRHRLQQGHDVYFPPGTDHAGLNAQVAAERELERQGSSRHALGREGFEQYMRSWKPRHELAILAQMRQLFLKADYEHHVHSLDLRRQKLMLDAFRRMHQEGQVYRDSALVNWCPCCGTCVGGQELTRRECTHKLYRLRLQQAGIELELGTLQLELLLGATALGIASTHPATGTALGRMFRIPGFARELRLIEVPPRERMEDRVTLVLPGHNAEDFDIARAHGEKIVPIYDERGFIADEHSEYAGMSPKDCRDAIERRLRDAGAIIAIEPYLHGEAFHTLCGTQVHPRPVSAWFLRTDALVPIARELLQENNFFCNHPTWEKRVHEAVEAVAGFKQNDSRWWEGACLAVVQDFSSNRDWILSRQNWWGYRIPAWHCLNCSAIMIDHVRPEFCARCSGRAFDADPDVFDPLFHSAWWAAMVSEDFAREPNADCAVLGVDILQFWLPTAELWSRMVFGRRSVGRALVHGLICDAQGRKMSKSLGNGMDLNEVLGHCSVEGVRFVVFSAMAGRDDAELIPLRDNLESGNADAARLKRWLLDVRLTDEPEQQAAETLHQLVTRVRAALDICRVGEAYSALQETIQQFADSDTPLWHTELVLLLRTLYPFHPSLVQQVVVERGLIENGL